mmetsp:Transcript_37763/g.79928  ORF Transcript_37763/g.79928 Transcript_37763/m.79928 type:complete len:1266 (-) Transcript_37763:430-4227(-)
MGDLYTQASIVARTIAVRIVQSLLAKTHEISSDGGQLKDLVELIMLELVKTILKMEDAAGGLLFRSFFGTLAALLRTRGTGDVKVTATRILGRIGLALSPSSEAMGRLPKLKLCEHCQVASKSPTRPTAERMQNQKTKVEPKPDSCDLCFVDFVERKHCETKAVQRSCGQASKAMLLEWQLQKSSQDGCMAASRSSMLDTFAFHLCSWAGEVSDQGDPRWSWIHFECHRLRQFGESKSDTCNRFVAVRPDFAGVRDDVDALLRPALWEQVHNLQDLRCKSSRALLTQLRSARAWIRTSAAKGLLSMSAVDLEGDIGSINALEATTNFSSITGWLTKDSLINLLTKDSSPHVRQAAVAYATMLLKVTGLAAGSSPPRWLLQQLLLAGNDVAPSVQRAAQKTLSCFVRDHPDDPFTLEACAYLIHVLCRDGKGSFENRLFDDLRAFFFVVGHRSSLPAAATSAATKSRHRTALKLLSLARGLQSGPGVSFLAGLLESQRNVLSALSYRLATQRFVDDLVAAFSQDADASLMSGLQLLAAELPWCFLSHLPTFGTFLAVSMPPSLSQEALAIGACGVIAEVIQTSGLAAVRRLSPWAWARIEHMVVAHSSRLARPAMRCLCVAAELEEKMDRILPHLKTAAGLLYTSLSLPSTAPGLPRAAWIVGTACEYCSLDTLGNLQDLQVPDNGDLDTSSGAGRALVSLLLLSFKRAFEDGSPNREVLPAIILALGFALRRHVELALADEAMAAFDVGLQLQNGNDGLLTERTMSSLKQLLEVVASEMRASKGQCCFGGRVTAGEVALQLSQHQPAVLRLLTHGLFGRAGPADGPIRASAMATLRTYQSMNLISPNAILPEVLPTLFADRILRRSAATLLCNLARQSSTVADSMANTVPVAVRKTFAAVAWQVPSMLDISDHAAVQRAAAELASVFVAGPKGSRMKWLHGLWSEVFSMTPEKVDTAKLVSSTPSMMAGAALRPGRLTPFSGQSRERRGSSKLPEGQVEPKKKNEATGSTSTAGHTEGDQAAELRAALLRLEDNLPSPAHCAALRFCLLLARTLAALPWSLPESENLQQLARRHLELPAAAVVSAWEHSCSGGENEGESGSGSSSQKEASHLHLFLSAVLAMLARSFVEITAAAVVTRREQATLFERAIEMQLPELLTISCTKSKEQLAEWLADSVGTSLKLPAKSRRAGRPPALVECNSDTARGRKRKATALAAVDVSPSNSHQSPPEQVSPETLTPEKQPQPQAATPEAREECRELGIKRRIR